MKLLTQEIKKRFEKIGSQEEAGNDAIVIAKFFCPWNNWKWFATEFNAEDEIFFGLVMGSETELGYFSLEEMSSVRGPVGMKLERDLYWEEQTIGEVRESIEKDGWA